MSQKATTPRPRTNTKGTDAKPDATPTTENAETSKPAQTPRARVDSKQDPKEKDPKEKEITDDKIQRSKSAKKMTVEDKDAAEKKEDNSQKANALLTDIKQSVSQLESKDSSNNEKSASELLKKAKELPNAIVQPRTSYIGEEVMTRKDIDSMDQSFKQNGTLLLPGTELNRFLRCLRAIQIDDELATGNPSTGSTYALFASVHGFPGTLIENISNKSSWTSAVKKFRDSHDSWSIHGAETFAEWNRIYIAAFERALQAAAAKDPEEKRYRYETKSMGHVCLPYWDWSKTDNSGEVIGLPPAVLAAQAKIDDKIVDNPLYQFKWISPIQFNGKSLVGGGGNIRNDDTVYKEQMRDNKTLHKVNRAMNEPFHHVFGGGQYQTMQAAHDDVHNAVGGVMCDIEWAAWDPLFWLLQCNVDRLLESWYQKWFKDNVRNGVINNIELYSPDHFVLQQELGPFYGELSNPWIDRWATHNYITVRDAIQCSDKYHAKYVTLYETEKNPTFQQFLVDSGHKSLFTIDITGLTHKNPMNLQVYILPMNQIIKGDTIPDRKYFVGSISILGGQALGSRNTLRNDREYMCRILDATRVMYSNNLTLRAKPYLRITSPGPEPQHINPDEYGITAHLKAACW